MLPFIFLTKKILHHQQIEIDRNNKHLTSSFYKQITCNFMNYSYTYIKLTSRKNNIAIPFSFSKPSIMPVKQLLTNAAPNQFISDISFTTFR